ncbi:MAG: DUF4184 family protein [Actinomycetota bacterium]
MPVTFPAHQAFVLPVKLAQPERVDATAMCIGAAAPDLTYASTTWLNQHGHTPLGVVAWGVPLALVASWIVRRWSARGIFAHLPDLGPWRLRSYGVVAHRRPPIASTVASAFVGAGSHVLVDAFTHADMWGAELLGWDVVRWEVAGHGVSPAGALQRIGHVGGSLLFVGLTLAVSRRSLLERWYGADALATARAVRPTPASSAAFWALTVVPIVTAWRIAPTLGRSSLFAAVLAAFAAVLFAGAVAGTMLAVPARQGDSRTRATMS